MKKTMFYLLAVAGPVFFLSSLDGPLPQNTGAPGDLTCGRSVCHNVPANVGNAEMSVTFNNNVSFYRADSTYLVTVRISNPQTMRNGFQILALDEAQQNAGTWQLLEPDKMKIIPGIGFPNRRYVTHRAAGNLQDEWTMAWKAPSASVGKVTFYAAVNATNNNGQLTGDEVYTDTVQAAFAETNPTQAAQSLPYRIWPTMATDFIRIEVPEAIDSVRLTLFDARGASVLDRVLPYGGIHEVSVADLSPGVYFLHLVHDGQAAAGRVVICR